MKTVITLQGIGLEKFGFVHVTGLTCVNRLPEHSEHVIHARQHELGRWDVNNGMFVAMTTEGEVWLAKCGEKNRLPNRYLDPKGTNLKDFLSTPEADFEKVLRELCPNGEGVGVPCSNGHTIDGHLIMGRLADATEDFCGLHSPEPVIGG